MAEQAGVLVAKTIFGCFLMNLNIQALRCCGLHWYELVLCAKLDGVWVQVAFLLEFGVEEVWMLFARFESCFGVT